MPYKNLPESEWGKMDRCVDKVMEKQPDLEKPNAIAICYDSITGKEYTPALEIEPVGAQYRVFDGNSGVTLKQVDTAREAAEWATAHKQVTHGHHGMSFPDDINQRINSFMTDGKDEEAFAEIGRGIDWVKTQEATQKATPESTKKETKRTIFDTLIDIFSSATGKEGRRNSNTDSGRLQQIHDLAVENGASCPMVFKQANGAYRWILLSTNSYQDRDGEIVSQQAQEADVERMNQTGNFGPLRLWHLGYPDTATKEAGPGLDVGACDYSQMFGRIRVESGTFTDNRVGAAIKQHSDKWAGSIGFFHPIDQPDRERVYQDSYTFERSLLPRSYASNPLTPLAAILKEQEMTTKEDKVKQLGDLLGDAALADTVLKQAEATEKAAADRGLKFKATDEPQPEPEPTPEPTPPTEPAPAMDYEAMAKNLAPFINAAIENHLAGAMKERTDKEATIATQITALNATLKETRQIVDVLNSDLPKGVKKFLASESDATLAPDGKYKSMEAPPANPLNNVFNWLTQPVAMPPVQTTPEK